MDTAEDAEIEIPCSKIKTQKPKFKIILTILAHGVCENICKKYIAKEKGKGNQYIDNFEESNYIDNISLYSMVPYGINNVSASHGESSRIEKKEFILKMYIKNV